MKNEKKEKGKRAYTNGTDRGQPGGAASPTNRGANKDNDAKNHIKQARGVNQRKEQQSHSSNSKQEPCYGQRAKVSPKKNGFLKEYE